MENYKKGTIEYKLQHFETVESFDLFNAAANTGLCMLLSAARTISRSRMNDSVNRNPPINKRTSLNICVVRYQHPPLCVCVCYQESALHNTAHLHTLLSSGRWNFLARLDLNKRVIWILCILPRAAGKKWITARRNSLNFHAERRSLSSSLSYFSRRVRISCLNKRAAHQLTRWWKTRVFECTQRGVSQL